MPSAETTLAEDIAPGKQVALEAPGVRYGVMQQDSGAVTLDGEAQPFAIMAVDLLAETIHVTNGGADPWAAGATLVVTWEGTLAEGPPVGSPPAGGDAELEARVAQLETTVESQQWQINNFESRISNNYTQIGLLQQRATDLEYSVAALQQEVFSGTDASSRIDSHEARLDSLEAAK